MKRRRGFTILEVLMFVTVSSLMFIGAMSAVRGRQAQVEFAQSVRELEAKFRDVINDVATGYFPSNDTIYCEVDSNQVVFGSIQASGRAPDEKGTNNLCVYIGRAIQINADNSENNIRIMTLVGKRKAIESTGALTSKLSEADAQAVVSLGPGVDSVSEVYRLLYGVRITKIINLNDSTDPRLYELMAFLGGFGLGGAVESQNVRTGVVTGNLGSDKSEYNASLKLRQLSYADEVDEDGFFQPSGEKGMLMCLTDASGTKNASLTLGAGSSSNVELKLDNIERSCWD